MCQNIPHILCTGAANITRYKTSGKQNYQPSVNHDDGKWAGDGLLSWEEFNEAISSAPLRNSPQKEGPDQFNPNGSFPK